MREYRGFCYPSASEFEDPYPAVPDYVYDLQAPGPLPPCPPPPPPPKEPERRVAAVGEGPHPTKRPPMLAPIPPKLPPKHTQIQPRCFTCKHFEMCSFKKDYLKTITLMQNDLGAPQFDYEWTTKYIVIPDFVGFPLMNQDDFFPKEIKFENDDHVGKLWLARFNGINYVNVVYKDRKYYILIKLVYNKETELYELKSCCEAFYKVEYELSNKSLEEIQLGLVDWREQIINAVMPPPPPKPDIINTTHFSANLNCDMYEWNKDSFEDAIEKLCKKYPYGVPIDEDGRALYHIATFHIAGGEVPYAPLYYGKKKDNIQPYIPPQPIKPPKPPKRRDDL